MMFSTIAGVVFLPTSLQSSPAWKSKWMPRKLSARFKRGGFPCAAQGAGQTATVTSKRAASAMRLSEQVLLRFIMSYFPFR